MAVHVWMWLSLQNLYCSGRLVKNSEVESLNGTALDVIQVLLNNKAE